MTVKWLPPHERPWNEASGYLGYYARTFLPTVFDLVDCDGGWPALWLYYQGKGRTMRLIEEKPHGQELHPSQLRAFGALGCAFSLLQKQGAYSDHSGIYVLHDAERLVAPDFPVGLERYAPTRSEVRAMSRQDFDDWLLLAEAGSETMRMAA